MNAYNLTIVADNYTITTQVMAYNEDLAFRQALYTLINSNPKIDLFDEELRYEAEFLEVVE